MPTPPEAPDGYHHLLQSIATAPLRPWRSFACDLCGALVGEDDLDRHSNWHVAFPAPLVLTRRAALALAAQLNPDVQPGPS